MLSYKESHVVIQISRLSVMKYRQMNIRSLLVGSSISYSDIADIANETSAVGQSKRSVLLITPMQHDQKLCNLQKRYSKNVMKNYE